MLQLIEKLLFCSEYETAYNLLSQHFFCFTDVRESASAFSAESVFIRYKLCYRIYKKRIGLWFLNALALLQNAASKIQRLTHCHESACRGLYYFSNRLLPTVITVDHPSRIALPVWCYMFQERCTQLCMRKYNVMKITKSHLASNRNPLICVRTDEKAQTHSICLLSGYICSMYHIIMQKHLFQIKKLDLLYYKQKSNIYLFRLPWIHTDKAGQNKIRIVRNQCAKECEW